MMVVLNHGNWQTLQIRVSPVGATFRKYSLWALPQIQENKKQKTLLTEDHQNKLYSRQNLLVSQLYEPPFVMHLSVQSEAGPSMLKLVKQAQGPWVRSSFMVEALLLEEKMEFLFLK